MWSFGPDLYHYAVRYNKLVIHFQNSISSKTNATTKLCKEDKTLTTSKQLRIDVMLLSRPLLVVLDTGLTGFIFSDLLTEELSPNSRAIIGKVMIGMMMNLQYYLQFLLSMFNFRPLMVRV